MAKKKEVQEESLEKQLWKSADKLRKNIDAAEYKHVVLGLIFLKYISDAFEELYAKLQAGEGEFAGADPEDKDEYKAENVFFVPADARWAHLQAHAKQPTIGKTVDEAMDAIEKENSSLKGVLPKVYARQNLDPTSLGELIDLIGNIALGDAKSRSADVLGHVFEYFLGEFALAEGKKGGQFYTPRSVVELLVEMLEPYKGRVLDPCCGSGGMFVQSEEFVSEHQGKINDISIYGQESNQTTWRLAKMNLAIRGIDSSQVKWNNEGSFLNDAHKDLKADYIIANPPFNVSDWSGDLLRKDGRWQYGTPPTGNANYAWIQHFLYHLSPKGVAGIVMHGGAASNKGLSESAIRQNIADFNLIDCIVALPTQLFFNTTLPVHLWILNRNKTSNVRSEEILMIDAYNLGTMVESTQRRLMPPDIAKISETYHSWKSDKNGSFNIPGFCKSVSKGMIKDKCYIMSPNRYIDRIRKVRDKPFVEDVKDLLEMLELHLPKISQETKKLSSNSDNFSLDYHQIFDVSNYDKSQWKPTELREIVNSIISGAWGNAQPKRNNIPVKVLRGTDLPNIPLFNLHKTPTRYLSEEKVSAIQLVEGDIVVEMSGGSKDQPTGRIGFITMELLEYFEIPVVCSNFCKVIRLSEEDVNPYWFYHYWLLSYKDGLTSRYENQPSGIKNFQLDEYLDSEIIFLPPDPIQDKISEKLKSLFKLRNQFNYFSNRLNEAMFKAFENIYYDFDK